MTKEELKQEIEKLIDLYRQSPEYKPPFQKKKYIVWHKHGEPISLGFNLSPKALNFEIHLPYYFLRVNLLGKQCTYYDVLIRV